MEIVQFLKNNTASKSDLDKFITKDDFQKTKNEIMNHMNDFIGLYQKLDTELTALACEI